MPQIERRQRELQRRYQAMPAAVAFAKDRKLHEGKIIGVKVPADMRAGLDALKSEHELENVKQAVLLVLHLGFSQLAAMEEGQ
jgi:hypothetical protein